MPRDDITSLPSPLSRHLGCMSDHPATALARFVVDHAAGLRTAAELMGGARHVRAFGEILDALGRDPIPNRRTLRQLDDLLLLLSLELVTDLESEEAVLFSLIDPADPVVADLCVLTDALRQALAAYRRSIEAPAPREVGRAA